MWDNEQNTKMIRNKTEMLQSDDNSHTYMEKQIGLRQNKNANKIEAAKLEKCQGTF
jgi:hypothetical protein